MRRQFVRQSRGCSERRGAKMHHPVDYEEMRFCFGIAQTAVDLIDLGNLALRQGNVALARQGYEESLVIWQALDDEPGMTHARGRLQLLEGVK
jgi:hypothetical protein